MAVLDEETTIDEQLAALAAQDYGGPWELVVVDNGCSDGSLELAERWRSRLPSLTIVDATGGRGLNAARNRGAAAARGEFLAFCDADDVVSQGWLSALAEAAPTADIIGGALEFDTLNEPRVRARWPRSPMRELRRGHGFLPYAAGGNCGVWADVARVIGWDTSFRFGNSDIEFCWRAQLAGYRIGFAADAVVHYRYRHSMLGLMRQSFDYGCSEALLYRRFRASGMPRPNSREARGHVLRLMAFRIGRITGRLTSRRHTMGS
jgi:glycosyltransferase involved in cell wall biosynthesis